MEERTEEILTVRNSFECRLTTKEKGKLFNQIKAQQNDGEEKDR